MYKLGDIAIYIGGNSDLMGKMVEVIGFELGYLYAIRPIDGTKLWYQLSVSGECLKRFGEGNQHEGNCDSKAGN